MARISRKNVANIIVVSLTSPPNLVLQYIPELAIILIKLDFHEIAVTLKAIRREVSRNRKVYKKI